MNFLFDASAIFIGYKRGLASKPIHNKPGIIRIRERNLEGMLCI